MQTFDLQVGHYSVCVITSQVEVSNKMSITNLSLVGTFLNLCSDAIL